jgi:adenosylcobinamide-GDP ribazoletransferase
VGAIGAGVRAAADQALPPYPATLLAIAASLLVTGGLHEDGFADVADALGAHVDRPRRLEILKDPRVGTFGALALLLAVGLTTTTIGALDTSHAVKALIVSHTLSRWAILPPSRFLQPAKPGGLGGMLRVRNPALLGATLIAAAVAVLAGAAWALFAAAASTALAMGVLRTGLGGISGDGYGATAKLAELATAATLAALWT